MQLMMDCGLVQHVCSTVCTGITHHMYAHGIMQSAYALCEDQLNLVSEPELLEPAEC